MSPRLHISMVRSKHFVPCIVLLAAAAHAAAQSEPVRIPSSALTDAARQNLIGGFNYNLPASWSLKSVPGAPFKVAFGREEDGNPANISFQVTSFSGNLGEFEANLLKQLPVTYETMGLTN